MRYDALIIGGGIAGMETALTLGDMGHKVLLVEKEASIGGKMILLSKVFPTLDCSSCISTPKMASTAHHPNVTVITQSEVKEIAQRDDGRFLAKVLKKATFVDQAKCTGCGDCESACTVAVADACNYGMVAHRAAHIIYPQAVPKKASITRRGQSPCSFTCPAGVKTHGYVSLVRAGKYEEAFRLHMEDAPIPGTLSRACYAPCENECTRGDYEGPVSIRGIKRFMVDYYYERHPEPEYGPPEILRKERVAVVGSGPSGLTAAYHLARNGYRVTIFESAEEPGGVLRYGIPPYRLPRDILDRDIKNITALGVEIRTDSKITSIKALKARGFDAVYMACGATSPQYLGIPGEDLDGIVSCMECLKRTISGEGCDIEGKTVLMFGGGNACVDPSRSAIRRGARRVIIQYRRTRAEMPAHHWEVEAALEEGVEMQFLKAPVRFLGIDGQIVGVESISMRLGEPDSSGRRRPIPIEDSEEIIPVEKVTRAIGLRPNTEEFAEELKLNDNDSIAVDPETMQTCIEGVFAGGDVVLGPSTIVEAVGQGKAAARNIHSYLQGSVEEEIHPPTLPMSDKEYVKLRAGRVERRDPIPNPNLPVGERIRGFDEIEGSITEEQARYSANRCLDCGVCSECHECETACPADAIDFDMRDEEKIIETRSVVIATGFELFRPQQKEMFGFGVYPNVITAMQMDRLLSPTRPYNHVIRPSDGKVPDNIAIVLCTGSRDHTIKNPYCSRICCMYSLKQAQLIMGAVPLADITIYFIDVRAFGKGYDEFYEQAKAMGVYLVHGKVARISETDSKNLTVTYENIEGGGMTETEHDLVVLSVGALPNPEAFLPFKKGQVASGPYGFVHETDQDLDPGRTSLNGVFVAGAASETRDIPDSIVHAGAAAAQAAAYIARFDDGTVDEEKVD